MQRSFRSAHLVVGAATVIAFLVTGLVMYRRAPTLSSMDWGDRLLFRSRHIYILCAGLVNLAMGVHYRLPESYRRRAAAMVASLLALASAVLCFFAFFAEPMGGRPPGVLSAFGLYALFGGVVLYAAANARRGERQSA